MVHYLLQLLNGGVDVLDNPAATKAQIVKALKAMQKSLAHGEQVGHISCHDVLSPCHDVLSPTRRFLIIS